MRALSGQPPRFISTGIGMNADEGPVRAAIAIHSAGIATNAEEDPVKAATAFQFRQGLEPIQTRALSRQPPRFKFGRDWNECRREPCQGSHRVSISAGTGTNSDEGAVRAATCFSAGTWDLLSLLTRYTLQTQILLRFEVFTA
jgi:hypothetical protein